MIARVKGFVAGVWRVFLTPVGQLLDLVLAYRLYRRGYVLVEAYAIAAAKATLDGAATYADKSGHLNTVKKRKPQAVKRVVGSMRQALFLIEPTRPGLGRKALSPSQALKRRRTT